MLNNLRLFIDDEDAAEEYEAEERKEEEDPEEQTPEIKEEAEEQN